MGPASDPWHRAGGADNPTRVLSAAAHLDERFAEEAIAEYLVEPYRSVPRSPGIDAAAVLGEAVASHERRRLRDGVLLACGIVLFFGGFPLFVLWLVVAAVVSAAQHARQQKQAGSGPQAAGRLLLFVVRALLMLVLGASVLVVSVLVPVLPSPQYGFEILSSLSLGAATVLAPLGALVVIPAVIVIDRLLVLGLLERSFRRSTYRPEPGMEPGALAALRRLGRGRFADALDRVRRAENDTGGAEADVAVFRGEDPFVGAGEVVERHAFVIPLERADGVDGPLPEVTEFGLHASILENMERLRRRSSLSPHARLETLTRHEQVLTPAYELLAHLPSPEAAAFFPHGFPGPVVGRFPARWARGRVTAPREWARYYQCFRVEGWERDLTMSCYVTLGTDGHLLYLEWTVCGLAPLQERFRDVDHGRVRLGPTLWGAFVDTVTFPVDLWSRGRRVFRHFAPTRPRADKASPSQYGAAQSLREMAAGTADNFFHAVDVIRYQEIFDRTVFEAVRLHLVEHGLQVAALDRVANYTINVGSATHSVFANGPGARAEAWSHDGPGADSARREPE